MSFLKTGISAIGKLFIVVALAASFLVGLFGVVYLSLRGEEIKVPEVTGKDFLESEKELTQLGLRIKRRATRYSQEKPNTVLEQSPKAGETAKTGQLILVVVSQLNPESTEAPATVEKEEEDTPVDELDDKSKKSNRNANVKKPAKTTRDGASNKPANNSNTATGETTKANTSSNSTKPSSTAPAANKPSSNPTSSPKTNAPKPSASKTPTSGETRTRRIPD